MWKISVYKEKQNLYWYNSLFPNSLFYCWEFARENFLSDRKAQFLLHQNGRVETVIGEVATTDLAW